jgi:hypothetical protein
MLPSAGARPRTKVMRDLSESGRGCMHRRGASTRGVPVVKMSLARRVSE